MGGLRFLRKEFYFLQLFKHAIPIIDWKFACERCMFFACYAKNFNFQWSVLNTLYRSMSEFSHLKDGLRFLCAFKYTLMDFYFQKKSCVFAMRILQRTWVNCVRSKNCVLFEHGHMSGMK